MLQVPVISIFIFLAIFIPSGLIGYFRGWKSSLFIFIALFVFMGGFFCLAYFLYDNIWWGMFKGMFLEKAGGSLVSLEGFKDVSQVTVIGLIMMIATPISYGLALLVHLPFKQKLKRSLYPAVKQNPNAKEEFKLVENNYVVQRSAGAVISVATGLLVASTVTAGVQSIAEPTTKNTFLTSITKPLSRVYSMGHGGYDDAFQLAYEFLPETQRVEVKTAFNALANINSNSASTLEQDLAYFADPANSDAIHKLAQSGDAFVAILKSLDANPTSRLEIWNYTDDITSGQPATGNGIDSNYFTTLETAILSIQLGIHLQTDTIDTIIEYIDTKLANFEQSTWYVNWEAAAKAVAKAENDLVEMKNKLASLNAELQAFQRELTGINAELTKRIERERELSGPNGNDGLVQLAVQKRDEARTASATADKVMSDFRNDSYYGDPNTHLVQGGGRAIFYEDEFRRIEMENAKSDLTIKESNLHAIESQISSLNTQLSNAINAKNQATTQMTGLQKQLVDIDNEIAALKTRRDQLTSDKNDKQAKLTKSSSDLAAAKTELSVLESSSNRLKSELDTIRAEIEAISSEIENLETQKQNATENGDANEVARIDALIVSKRKELTDKQAEEEIKNNEIKAVDIEIGKAQSIVANAQREFDRVKSEFDSLVSTLAGVESEITSKSGTRLSIQHQIDQLQQQINEYDATITSIGSIDNPTSQLGIVETRRVAAVTERDNALATFNTKDRDYQTYHKNIFEPAKAQDDANVLNAKNKLDAKIAAESECTNLQTEQANLQSTDVTNPASIIYQQDLKTKKETDISNKEAEIAQKEVDINTQEDLIVTLKTDPVKGEENLRGLRDENERIYSENINRYNQLIRRLLMS